MSTDHASGLDHPPSAPSLRGAPEPAHIDNVRLGTASWTERTLLESNAFYPPAVRTPADRLRYYARHFSVVEVDATYYALPSVRNTTVWAARTPGNFRFGVKAFAAMTGHPVDPARLDRDLRQALPAERRRMRTMRARELPAEIRDEIWRRFAAALAPLRAAGKLGYVLMQLPPWTRPASAAFRYIERLAGRLPHDVVAVEFREATWLAPPRRAHTLALLRDHRLAYVSVDEPQGTAASVPPLALTTRDDVAVVRFHGRRRETWTEPGVGTSERFRHRYRRAELAEWVPRIRALAAGTRSVYVLMNNCYREYAVQGAKDLARLLVTTGADPHPTAG